MGPATHRSLQFLIELVDEFLAQSYTVLVLTCILAFFLGCAIYDLEFHSLASFPGPFWCRVTNLVHFYYVWTGNEMEWAQGLHQKYGDLVRYRPNQLSINTPDALQVIYGHGAPVNKPRQIGVTDFLYTSMIFSLRNKVEHAWRRRVVAQVFNERHLREVEPLMIQNINNLLEALRDVPEEPGFPGTVKDGKDPQGGFDMGQWFSFLTWDVLSNLAFSQCSNLITSKNLRYLVAWSESLGWLAALNQISSYLWQLMIIDIFVYPRGAIHRIQFFLKAAKMANLRASMQPHLANPHQDFFGYVLDARDPQTGRGYSTRMLQGEMLSLMFAGTDTTKTALCATLFYLLKNPKWLHRVTREIRENFEMASLIRHCNPLTGRKEDRLDNCRILRACIVEAMRLCPSLPSWVERQVQHPGLRVKENVVIPGGVTVAAHFYTLHRHPRNWPDPDKYDPERWLMGCNIEAMKRNFGVFGYGPRRCVGQPMAVMELHSTIARLVWSFDMEYLGGGEVPGKPDQFRVENHYTGWTEGPKVKFTDREDLVFIRVPADLNMSALQDNDMEWMK